MVVSKLKQHEIPTQTVEKYDGPDVPTFFIALEINWPSDNCNTMLQKIKNVSAHLLSKANNNVNELVATIGFLWFLHRMYIFACG